jgi:hypothetical protein
LPAARRCALRGPVVATALSWLAISCAATPTQSPISEYVAGIKDAIDSSQPERLPTLVVTWDAAEAELGQCRRIAGQTVVYLHVGRILESAATVAEARSLITEVLVHELAHARLTCTDADHAHLPAPAARMAHKSPTLLKQYAWDEFGLSAREQRRSE